MDTEGLGTFGQNQTNENFQEPPVSTIDVLTSSNQSASMITSTQSNACKSPDIEVVDPQPTQGEKLSPIASNSCCWYVNRQKQRSIFSEIGIDEGVIIFIITS